MGSPGFHCIYTDRLILRRFREEDAEAFLRYRSRPDVALYQGEGWIHFKPDQALAFVKKQMDFEPGEPDTWFQIAIERKDSGELIGDCGIHTLPNDTRQAEIGYTIAPEHQGSGYAKEALRSLLAYLFGQLKIHRVIAVTDTRNSSSIKMLERLGMRREGHFLQHAWYNGEYADEYLYALLQEEWSQMQESNR